MKLWSSIHTFLNFLFHRSSVEREMEEEFRAHLRSRADDLERQGLSRAEAERQARIEFGGYQRYKEECREALGTRLLSELVADMRFGLRQLRRNPGFTAVAIITLALGIGANTAIFSLIDTVMLRMLPVPRPNELFQVEIRDPQAGGDAGRTFTNPLWEQLRDQQDVFSGIFAWGHDRFDLAQGGAVHYVNGIWVSGNFFSTLMLHPALGRLILASDDRRGCAAVAVLSYGFWQNQYGGEDRAIGSTLSLDGHPFEVIGVAPYGFYGIDVGEKFDVAVPICASALFDGKESRLDHRSWWWLRVMGRIRPGMNRAQLIARLAVLSPSIFTAALPHSWAPNAQRRFVKDTLVVTPAANGTSSLRLQFDRPLDILMGVVGLVLLVACGNIASLMLARTAARHKEIAVRQALGASRMRLIRQLLTECILLSSVGAVLGILFARWGSVLLVRYISTTRNTVFLDLSLDGHVLGFTAVVAVVTGILFGALPTIRSTRVLLTSAMKASHMLESKRPGRFGPRKWIVASQMALSLIVLVAAGLLLRSFAKLATLDVGFDRNNVLLVKTNLQAAKVPPDRLLATYEQIERRLRALPGVVSVSWSDMTPMGDLTRNSTIRTDWSKALTDEQALVWFNYVSPEYFRTLRIPLLAGHNFDSRDTKAAPAIAIVNQTLARRFFPNLNPIGRTFRVDSAFAASGQPGPPIEVVGLMKDSKYGSIRENAPPTAFLPVTQIPTKHAGEETFELRTAIRPSALVTAVQTAVTGINKEIPLEFRTLAEQVGGSLLQERLLAMLSGFFGALAMLLAVIGIYGTFNYLVTQRQTEIGIRMALGAQKRDVLRLVVGQGMILVLIGVGIGTIGALGLTRFLSSLLYGVKPTDPVTFVIVSLLLSGVALLACYVPARRATKVDPMVALRYE